MKGRQLGAAIRRCSRILRALCCACLAVPAGAAEFEMAALTVQDTFVTPAWTQVTFLRAFPTTPVVFVLPTTNGGDPMSLRIRNVTTTGFEVIQTEPSANDGLHLQNDTAYLAAEVGSHVLPDGSRFTVRTHATTSFATRLISTTWDTLAFPAAFNATPAIVAQIQTMANEANALPGNPSVPFMDVGVRNVNTATMQVTLERAESPAGAVNVAETIGIIAVESAANASFTDFFGASVTLQTMRTPANVRGYDNGCFTNNYPVPFAGVMPLSVASANTRAGNNGGWVRRCSQAAANIGLTFDEDIDTDAERAHIGEAAGVIAASIAFHATFDVDLLVSKTVAVQNDPYNGAANPKSIPNAEVEYTIEVENRGSVSPDLDSLIITDEVPADLRLCVVAACQPGGPVVLDTTGSPVPPGVTVGTVAYSDDGGTTWVYVPIPDADGFDDAVDALQVTMDGIMAPIAPAGAPSFQLMILARVN